MGFKPKTCVRYNEPWHAHALTFSCFHKQPLLQTDHAAQLFVDALSAAASRYEMDLWGYVIMPDHVHLLLCPQRETYDISRVLFAIKRPMSYRAKDAGLFEGKHFWQPGGGYDRNLWKARTIHKELGDMHENPVRRGLCEQAEDWRYSSAGYYAGEEDVPLVMSPTLPPREGF